MSINQQLARRTIASFSLLAVVVLVASAIGSTTAAESANEASYDDGMRLTANGWEHLSGWQVPPKPPSPPIDCPWQKTAGLALIACGLAGTVYVLMIEIDPMEERAFRIRRGAGLQPARKPKQALHRPPNQSSATAG